MENHEMFGAVLQTNPGNSNSSSQPSLSPQPHTSPHPPQPGIGMKPSSGPPVGALQTVQNLQAAAGRHTVSHMDAANYDTGNPVINPATAGLMIPNQQMQVHTQSPISQIEPEVPNRMLIMRLLYASWKASGYVQNQQHHQNLFYLPGPWRQLIRAFKSPVTAQKQQIILAILRANPQIMADFRQLAVDYRRLRRQRRKLLSQIMGG